MCKAICFHQGEKKQQYGKSWPENYSCNTVHFVSFCLVDPQAIHPAGTMEHLKSKLQITTHSMLATFSCQSVRDGEAGMQRTDSGLSIDTRGPSAKSLLCQGDEAAEGTLNTCSELL
ncbi:MAG: hypothetical protein ABSE27_07360 [Acidobacteriaceae bacterium]